jgi:glycosyltransferase involved in cell wall biosynthesis
MRGDHFLFVSTMAGSPWGGSEELWSRAAHDLAGQGFAVGASVLQWSPPHKRVLDLMKGGVEVRFRPTNYSLWKRTWRRLTSRAALGTRSEVEKLLAERSPALVVFSDGGPFSSVDLLELCVAKQVPFVTIGQANGENRWLEDRDAARYRVALATARRCYFVSNANRRLAEKHLGFELPNAEVIWNPFNIDYRVSLPWPELDGKDELRLACVARLDPSAKGQDVLLEALADPRWAARNWRLSLFGEGPMRDVLERLAKRLGLSNRVTFLGHQSVEDIWASSHALVMPSRYEGLPLAMVEAMLCARPVVATDVAGHSEIVEDGLTGFLADAPIVSSIADALERLWTNRAKLEEMGRRGSKRIREVVPTDPVRVFSEKIKNLVRNPVARETSPVSQTEICSFTSELGDGAKGHLRLDPRSGVKCSVDS